jgi:ABC-type thiamine transport system substrate-binding protein
MDQYSKERLMAPRSYPSGISQMFLVVTMLIAGTVGVREVLAAEVNVYSGRKEALIRPVLDQFTEQTDIVVNLVSGEAGQLRERLLVEGRNSPADVLITADAANLHRAMVAGLFQPIDSEVLDGRIPVIYRDSGQTNVFLGHGNLPGFVRRELPSQWVGISPQPLHDEG